MRVQPCVLQLLPSYLGGTATLVDIQEAAARLPALHCSSKQTSHSLNQPGLASEDRTEEEMAMSPPQLPQVMVAAS
jgi:hypothetical protein